MRKIIILLFVIVTNLNAQNVGIGTVNPLEQLHITGDLRIGGLANTDVNVVRC